MVSNHGHECKANRTTYSQEVDMEHDGAKSLLLPLLTIPFLLFPPGSLIFLLFASLAIDVRHPCPPINIGGCNEALIFERCTRVREGSRSNWRMDGGGVLWPMLICLDTSQIGNANKGTHSVSVVLLERTCGSVRPIANMAIAGGS
jgi:hypothetical protein